MIHYEQNEGIKLSMQLSGEKKVHVPCFLPLCYCDITVFSMAQAVVSKVHSLYFFSETVYMLIFSDIIHDLCIQIKPLGLF